MGQKQDLIAIIGQEKYDELVANIPERILTEINVNFSEYLLTKDEQGILNFYGDLLNNTTHTSTPKLVGDIMIFTSHIHDLLKRIVETKENDETIKSKVVRFDLHYLILFCVARYNIPNDHFGELMELKHYRNLVAHDFNSVLETHPKDLMEATAKGAFLVIVLVGILRGD